MAEALASDTKRCPYCGELILIEAVKCRHCGEWFARIPSVPPVPEPTPRTSSQPSAQTSGKAPASLACALLGGGLLGIPAVLLGRAARTDIQRSGGTLKGDGMALAGTVLGAAQTVLIGVALLIVDVLALTRSSGPTPFSEEPRPSMPNGPIQVDVAGSNTRAWPHNVSAVKTGDQVAFSFTLAVAADCQFLLYPSDESGLANRIVFDRHFSAGANSVTLSRDDGTVASTGVALIACYPFDW